jgi:CHAD domain-containing protein
MASEEVAVRVKSFLRETLDHAQKQLRGRPQQMVGEPVHEARKSIKQLRAVLRLAREMADKEKLESVATHLREAAHRLGPLRDAEVLRATIQGLKKRDEPAPPPMEIGDPRAVLRQTRAHLRQAATALRKLIDSEWDTDGLKAGLRRLYKRSRHAMRQARKSESDDYLHLWRRRTKDLYYALKVLPGDGGDRALIKKIEQITSHLGDDHDLAFLQQHVSSQAPGTSHHSLLRRARKRRGPLQKKAFKDGRRVLDQSAHAFARRILG